MRIALLLAAFILPVFAASGKGTPVDLTGSWKEIRRTAADQQEVRFTDTLRIDFLIGNEYIWQKAGSFLYKGTYKATAEMLDLGARTFTIVRRTPSQLVLKDEAGRYELSKYVKTAAAEDNAQAASSARSDQTAAGEIRTDELSGKWEVYKRTSSVQLTTLDYTQILRTINIQMSSGRMSGVAMPAQHGPQTAGWTIERFERNTIYCSGNRSFAVKRCAGRELILQEGTMTYFFRKSS